MELKIFGGGNIKRIVNIEINDTYIKITLIRKNRKSIYIDKCIIKNISMSKEYDNHIKNNANEYVSQVVKIIKEEIDGFNKKYKDIHYNMQNDSIIIRNVKILNIKSKKDIKSMIEFEITQYIPINIDDYALKYKILGATQETLDIQVMLVPTYMIDLCENISNMLNMKPKNLSINYDILQKIISLELIKDFEDNGIFIECKDKEFILNIVKNRLIYESYILPKTTQSYQSVLKLMDEFKNIYYYGLEDYNIINQFQEVHNFQIIKIKDDINILKNENYLKSESMEYINSIGMII